METRPCRVSATYLKDPLLSEVLVRNLRDGGWSQLVGEMGRLHPRAKELFEKIGDTESSTTLPCSVGNCPHER